MIPCLFIFLRGMEYEYWHSKRITTPKYKLLPDLVLQQDVFLDSAVYDKKKTLPIIFKMAPCIPPGGKAMTVTVHGYFRRILQLSFIHECPGTCECPKSTKNYPARYYR